MKYTIVKIFLAVFLCAPILGACKDSGGAVPALEGENLNQDASYALGMNIGASLKTDSIVPIMGEFLTGLTDALSGKDTRLTSEQAMEVLNNAFAQKMETDNAGFKQEEIDFLAENSKKAGVQVTASGLQYEVMSEGSGAKPAATSTVRVNYEGTFRNGEVFDSSYTRGEPTEFPLNGVIPGWTEGIQLMSVGSKYRFCIPSELGYGAAGIPQMIPPFSTLIFEVELLSIVSQ